MPKKYSEIKKILKVDLDKSDEQGLANLTHYLQNYSRDAVNIYEKKARQFIAEINPEKGKVKDIPFQSYLPLKWDIPFPPPKKPQFKYIDLFAGIGGIRLAFQNLGGKCVFTSEWNKFAQKTYEANFGEYPFGDITKISEKERPRGVRITKHC